MFDNADGRIRGARGVEIRRLFLQRNPLCAHCQARGIVRQADEVDHIVPLHQQGPDTDANKQALCKECHRAKTDTEHGSSIYAAMFPEWIEPAACHLTIVFGAPGSGKSTHVQQHAKPGDLVIDLDCIMADISGLPMYHVGPEWLHRAVRRRNKMIGSLKRHTGAAWLIATGLGQADRDWWANKLKPASVVVMDTSKSDCIARIKADQRRPEAVKQAHIAVVHRWFATEVGYTTQTTGRKVEIGLDGWPV